jgi:hypothetical protein
MYLTVQLTHTVLRNTIDIVDDHMGSIELDLVISRNK